ncbi:DUF2755 family protein [Escherichia coli]|uniref:DUF2755 family protein n=1 Tax=Escherichia coli TaxID=562 RepID=UPI000251449D|nr:DUF2755 family protein [Escherichia coli]EHW04713.1 inner membrane YaiY domain protein [Escherichia coli DEC7E]
MCIHLNLMIFTKIIRGFISYERLMQVQETGRPRVEIGLGVGTIFGLIPFLVGCLIFAVVALWLHWRHRRQ